MLLLRHRNEIARIAYERALAGMCGGAGVVSRHAGLLQMLSLIINNKGLPRAQKTSHHNVADKHEHASVAVHAPINIIA